MDECWWGMEASKIVADLKLREGYSIVLFGRVESQILIKMAEAVGGFGNIMLLYREARPPEWALTFLEKGLKARRSMLFEHNDFLPSSSFEAIIAQNVVDKLLGKREFLGEAYRLLKPAGRFVIIQRLWPFTSLRKKEFRALLNGARSYSLVESKTGLTSAYAVLERPT